MNYSQRTLGWIAIFLLFALTLFGCNNKPDNIVDEKVDEKINDMPRDFQIVFSFGLKQAKQYSGINTKDNTIV